MSATKTLSVRLPIDVINNIENICKHRNINRNKLLQEMIASEGLLNVNTFKRNADVEQIPDMLHDILLGISGVATGTVVYHVLKNNLPKSWDDDTREIVSILSSIASGFAMTYGLHRMSKK